MKINLTEARVQVSKSIHLFHRFADLFRPNYAKHEELREEWRILDAKFKKLANSYQIS